MSHITLELYPHQAEAYSAAVKWLATQRNIRNGCKAGKLTRVQIDRLDALGIVWDNMMDQAWETHFEEARKYKELHGHLNIPSSYVDSTGFALGKWVIRMRMKWQRRKELTAQEQQQLARLDDLGMVWDSWQHQWQTSLEHARRYYRQQGNLLVPASYKTADDFALGQWIYNLRAARRGTMAPRTLTPEQIDQLNQIGMYWGEVQEDRWMQWYRAAQDYFSENGDLAVKKDYVTADGKALGVWLVNQRANRKKNEGITRAMSPERIRLLDELGMRW